MISPPPVAYLLTTDSSARVYFKRYMAAYVFQSQLSSIRDKF